MSLATKYRPKTLDEIIGQDITKEILLREISMGNISNTYLFTGMTGCGKTTFSRALAYAINNGVGDPIEIDAASNSGVESVRELIKSANERSLTGTYKVIIIDEAHSFSNAAWQALLKYFESPSPFTIFILCTTEYQKVPATILNRVQQFNLTRIKTSEIINRLIYICQQEHVDFEESALEFIAHLSEGSLRDAIAKLEKCISYSPAVYLKDVVKCLGEYSYTTFFKLVNSIIDGEERTIINILHECSESGIDLKLFINRFLDFCLDLTKFTIFNSCEMLKIPSSMEEDIKRAVGIEFAHDYYVHLVDKLLELKLSLKDDISPLGTCEIVLLQAARCQW